MHTIVTVLLLTAGWAIIAVALRRLPTAVRTQAGTRSSSRGTDPHAGEGLADEASTVAARLAGLITAAAYQRRMEQLAREVSPAIPPPRPRL